MIHLFVNYYQDNNPIRNRELVKCFMSNISNKLIDRVYVFISDKDLEVVFPSPNITFISHNGRPTYQEIFTIINTIVQKYDISIICNSDMIFDSTLSLIHNIQEDQCYALSRWEFGVPVQIQVRSDSQDTWLFRGPIKNIDHADFSLGVRGCDNRIAYELLNAGYEVLNPSLSIKTWHLHKSEVRRHDYHTIVIPPPYHKIPLTSL